MYIIEHDRLFVYHTQRVRVVVLPILSSRASSSPGRALRDRQTDNPGIDRYMTSKCAFAGTGDIARRKKAINWALPA